MTTDEKIKDKIQDFKVKLGILEVQLSGVDPVGYTELTILKAECEHAIILLENLLPAIEVIDKPRYKRSI